MLRRSPRLMLNHPNRQLFHGEHPVRNTRRRTRRRSRVISEMDVHEFEIMEGNPFPSFERIRQEFVQPPAERPPIIAPVQEDEQLIQVIPFMPMICSVFLYFVYIIFMLSLILALIMNSISFHMKHTESTFLRELPKKQSLKIMELETIIHKALKPHNPGMADFALQSLGASVIASTPTHKPNFCHQFPFSIWCEGHGPEAVLQPEVFPGKRWCFKGSQGHMVIALPHPVHITHVTLEHLLRKFSLSGHIRDAPKDFVVHGLDNDRKEWIRLGQFTFDQHGEPTQTFEILDSGREMFKQVSVWFISNWGHPEYTCVYRFKVHSQPSRDKKRSKK